MTAWPGWWGWELELSSHLLKRMVDRRFNEADLRLMMEGAGSYHEDHEEDRWAIETTHADRKWEIIVEPLPVEKILLVVTAYPIE